MYINVFHPHLNMTTTTTTTRTRILLSVYNPLIGRQRVSQLSTSRHTGCEPNRHATNSRRNWFIIVRVDERFNPLLLNLFTVNPSRNRKRPTTTWRSIVGSTSYDSEVGLRWMVFFGTEHPRREVHLRPTSYINDLLHGTPQVLEIALSFVKCSPAPSDVVTQLEQRFPYAPLNVAVAVVTHSRPISFGCVWLG